MVLSFRYGLGSSNFLLWQKMVVALKYNLVTWDFLQAYITFGYQTYIFNKICAKNCMNDTNLLMSIHMTWNEKYYIVGTWEQTSLGPSTKTSKYLAFSSWGVALMPGTGSAISLWVSYVNTDNKSLAINSSFSCKYSSRENKYRRSLNILMPFIP